MALDGGTVTIGPVLAGAAAGAFVVGAVYGAWREVDHILETRRKEAEKLKDRMEENAQRSACALPGRTPTLQISASPTPSVSSPPGASFVQAVWESRGKDLVLKLGAAIVLTFSASQLQAMELKPAARLIHQQLAEHYPDADVSFSNCRFAAVELGKQGGLKNIVEDVR